jgi:hypothetical protein
MCVILAIQEMEIGRMTVQSQPGQMLTRTYFVQQARIGGICLWLLLLTRPQVGRSQKVAAPRQKCETLHEKYLKLQGVGHGLSDRAPA